MHLLLLVVTDDIIVVVNFYLSFTLMVNINNNCNLYIQVEVNYYYELMRNLYPKPLSG